MGYFDITRLAEIRSADLITYSALVLAYAAYTWSIKRDLNSWKSLFVSLKKDLETQSAWLGTEYFAGSYNDKQSYSPSKIIYPLSFESLPEIIRRGAVEISGVSRSFINHLSLFNERLIAFNSALSHVQKICSSDPIRSEKLKDELNAIGLDDPRVSFSTLKKTIYKAKKNNDLFYLAENLRRLQCVIHVKIIGNKNDSDKLHFLYTHISKEVDDILRNFNKNAPWFVKYEPLIIALSFILFLITQRFLV